MKFRRKTRSISIIAAASRVRLAICLVILFPLGWLCKQTLEKKTFEFDNFFLLWLHEFIHPIFGYVLSAFYFIGDTKSAAVVVLLSLGLLCWRNYWKEAKILVAASLGVLLLVDGVLKPLFARPRPPLSLNPSAEGFSFPSGHATGNLMLYFYLSYLLAARFPKITIYIYGVTIGVLVLMGLGSMYLRVHWPTDIIAGYGFGYLWLTICLMMLNFLSTKAYKKT